MPYPEYFIAPMRGEMSEMGAKELRTAAAVDDVVKNSKGVVMMVVNSVCGCAAGKARPGIALALRHPNKPDVLATVFAGADIEATDRARQYFSGYAPSSPSIARNCQNCQNFFALALRARGAAPAQLVARALRAGVEDLDR